MYIIIDSACKSCSSLNLLGQTKDLHSALGKLVGMVLCKDTRP